MSSTNANSSAQTSQTNSQNKRQRNKKHSARQGPTAPVENAKPRQDQRQSATLEPLDTTVAFVPNEIAEDSAISASNLCWICAEPVRFWAVSECNHRTCHVCALRLRALYKKMDCTFCKLPQEAIIYTTSPDDAFASYTPEMTPFKDPKLSILFETQDMMEETLLLLRYNCPEGDCTFFGNGWQDLKAHVRTVHKKAMCDLCIRYKRIFAHEHTLYAQAELVAHVPSMGRRHQARKDVTVEGGVHPLCEFCHECFFGDDELYVHMREQHEKCFVCEREGRKFAYFKNYEELELHFTDAHYPCNHPTCLAQKFVVFASSIDLKAHSVEMHGGDMSARDKRDARRVADFSFQPEQPEREPAQPRSSRRRNGFGGALTSEATTSSAQQPRVAILTQQREEPPETLEPDVAERQAEFIGRFSASSSLAVKSAIRSFRASESTAKDIILTLFNVFDRDLDATNSSINGLVHLYEEEKRRDLLGAWNSFKLEQRREFPDLVPSGTGTDYSGIAAGRVLNAKHSTARGASNRRVWDRVAQAAASSSVASGSSARQQPPDRFPALQPSASSTSLRPGQRSTPWTSSSAAASSSSARPAANTYRSPAPDPKPGGTTTPPVSAPRARAPAPLSSAQFPSLPAASGPSHATRTQGMINGNASLRNIVGPSAAPANPWGSAKRSESEAAEQPAGRADGDSDTVATEAGKGKKKGKQKQTLFTLGAFPV